MQTMAQIEKSIPSLRQEFARSNAEQLNAVSAEVVQTAESRVGSMTDQLARSEAMVRDFSAYIERLEAKRDDMEEDTIASLRVRFQELEPTSLRKDRQLNTEGRVLRTAVHS